MSLSFSPRRCPSPPPPMPSPVLVPTPLQSPPPLTKKPSRSRLSAHPPGSVKKTLNHAVSHDALHRPPKLFHSADDPLEPALPSVRTIKRTLSHLPSRCRSPPPSPAVRSPPPPVPPIPAFVLTTHQSFVRSSHKPSVSNRAPALDLYLDRSREDSANIRCKSKADGTLTCVQFLAVHNQTGQCGA